MSDNEIAMILLVFTPIIMVVALWNTPDEVLFLNIDIIIFTRPYSWIKAIIMLLGGSFVCRVFNGYYVLNWINGLERSKCPKQ